MHATNINEQNKQQDEYLINNGRRYQVTIPSYFKEQDYIVYQAYIYDSAFNRNYYLHFRFKALKKLHEQMMKHKESDHLPDFPKTRSFCLWNKTNQDPTMIQDRIRDLEYYLVKILNNGRLQKLQQIEYIRKTLRSNQQKRRFSYQHSIRNEDPQLQKFKFHQCPELHKKNHLVFSLL